MRRFWFMSVVCVGLVVAASAAIAATHVGGKVTPDGKTEIQIDLPEQLHKANISVNRSGCCVFRSADHASHWAGEPAFHGFPEWMKAKGITGGGWPEKFDKLAKQIAADRGLPVPEYLQVEGDDLEILKAALKSGRMVSVTYNYSPTPGRYRGNIAHMVNIVHGDDEWFCVLDNNFIGERNYQWMDPATFRRVYTGGRSGWAIILLKHGPPPPPRN